MTVGKFSLFLSVAVVIVLDLKRINTDVLKVYVHFIYSHGMAYIPKSRYHERALTGKNQMINELFHFDRIQFIESATYQCFGHFLPLYTHTHNVTLREKIKQKSSHRVSPISKSAKEIKNH